MFARRTLTVKHAHVQNSLTVHTFSQKSGVSLDRAKWACLDAVISLAVQCATPNSTSDLGPVSGSILFGSMPPTPPHPLTSSLSSSSTLPPLTRILRPDICRSLLVEALDVLQYCLEAETMVVLRVLRRCWGQFIREEVQEQVRRRRIR